MTTKKRKVYILVVGCLIKNGKTSIFAEANKGTASCVTDMQLKCCSFEIVSSLSTQYSDPIRGRWPNHVEHLTLKYKHLNVFYTWLTFGLDLQVSGGGG